MQVCFYKGVINIAHKQNNIISSLINLLVLAFITINALLLAISVTGLNYKFFKYIFPGINY